jgi:GNAT superfamily N-acetyltransferase
MIRNTEWAATLINRRTGRRWKPASAREGRFQISPKSQVERSFEMQPQLNPASVRFTCSVRSAKPGDYDKMADLAEQLGYPSTGNQVRMRLGAITNSSPYAVFVAELSGGQIAGWIGLYVFRSVEQDSCAGISGLIVDRQIRGRAIGQLLLGAAEDWARSQGCSAISVHTNITRERAHRFYTRHGYEHIKTQKYLLRTLQS